MNIKAYTHDLVFLDTLLPKILEVKSIKQIYRGIYKTNLIIENIIAIVFTSILPSIIPKRNE